MLTEIYCRFTITRLSYHTTGWHLLDKEVTFDPECQLGTRGRGVILSVGWRGDNVLSNRKICRVGRQDVAVFP